MVNWAKDWYTRAMARWETFDVRGLLPALRFANEGAKEDVLNTNGCRYYQWSACLVDVFQPKQVVELGAAMGVWDLCVLHYLPETSKLYAATLAEGGLEFSYVQDSYSNFIPVTGNDLDLGIWPKDIDFTKTDLWFFDSLHEENQLRSELDLYNKYRVSGSLALFDDIRMPEIWPVWKDIVSGKYGNCDTYEATNPLHYSGFGMVFWKD